MKKYLVAMGLLSSLAFADPVSIPNGTSNQPLVSGNSGGNGSSNIITLLDSQYQGIPPGSYKTTIKLPNVSGDIVFVAAGSKGGIGYYYYVDYFFLPGGNGGTTTLRVSLDTFRSRFGDTVNLYYVVGGGADTNRHGGSASGIFINGFPWLNSSAIPLVVGGGGGDIRSEGYGGNNNAQYCRGFTLYHYPSMWVLNGLGRFDAIRADRNNYYYYYYDFGHGFGYSGGGYGVYYSSGCGYCNTSIGVCEGVDGNNDGNGFVKVYIELDPIKTRRLN